MKYVLIVIHVLIYVIINVLKYKLIQVDKNKFILKHIVFKIENENFYSIFILYFNYKMTNKIIHCSLYKQFNNQQKLKNKILRRI